MYRTESNAEQQKYDVCHSMLPSQQDYLTKPCSVLLGCYNKLTCMLVTGSAKSVLASRWPDHKIMPKALEETGPNSLKDMRATTCLP